MFEERLVLMNTLTPRDTDVKSGKRKLTTAQKREILLKLDRPNVGDDFRPKAFPAFDPAEIVDRVPNYILAHGPKRLYRFIVFKIGNDIKCWWSVSNMARELGVCSKTVDNWLVKLVDWQGGLIRRQRRGTTSNHTYLIWHPLFNTFLDHLRDGEPDPAPPKRGLIKVFNPRSFAHSRNRRQCPPPSWGWYSSPDDWTEDGQYIGPNRRRRIPRP